MKNGTKIVSSIYELDFEESRCGGIYKSYPLTSLTIRDIIFDGFEYVIYTDKNTYEKYGMYNDFNQPNVTIKFQELNQKLYKKILNPIRKKRFEQGDIWERYYAIHNYVEVIFNKFKHVLDEAQDGYNTFWIDAGLFGTSCNDGWRDYMVEIAHTPNFLNKINEKINEYGFICTRGKDIQINIDLKTKLTNFFDVDFSIIPGCLFGGNKEMILQVLGNYETCLRDFCKVHQELISEQEILSILTHKNDVKFYDFGDWLDLQRAFLNIMDVFDEAKYIVDSCELYSTKYLDRYMPYR